MAVISETPPLIVVAQAVVDEHQYMHVDVDTGHRVGENHPYCTILDVVTAHMLVTCYDVLKDKTKFQQAIDKVGVVAVVNMCWGAIRKK